MQLFLFFIPSVLFSLSPLGVFADAPNDIRVGSLPTDIIAGDGGLIGIAVLIQSILLKGVLPIVVIGVFLYAAYELFTAEWDEAKMKKAWKTFTFSGIALVIIALAYVMVAVIPQISL